MHHKEFWYLCEAIPFGPLSTSNHGKRVRFINFSQRHIDSPFRLNYPIHFFKTIRSIWRNSDALILSSEGNAIAWTNHVLRIMQLNWSNILNYVFLITNIIMPNLQCINSSFQCSWLWHWTSKPPTLLTRFVNTCCSDDNFISVVDATPRKELNALQGGVCWKLPYLGTLNRRNFLLILQRYFLDIFFLELDSGHVCALPCRCSQLNRKWILFFETGNYLSPSFTHQRSSHSNSS